MRHDQLVQAKKHIQTKLAIWIVMTVSFYILQLLMPWPILTYVAWLSSGYCVVLFCIFGTLSWRLIHHSK